MRVFATAPGEHAALARKVLAGYVSYAFHRAAEGIASLEGVDLIMGFGFNWAPPGVLVDTIGLRAMVEMIDKARLPVPKLLSESLAKGEKKRFFTHSLGNVGRYFVAG